MMVSFNPDCLVDRQTITLHYAKGAETHQPMDRTITLEGRADRPVERFIFSAFYRPSQHFAGIEMSAAARECVVSISRLEGASPLPAQLSIALSRDWNGKACSIGSSDPAGGGLAFEQAEIGEQHQTNIKQACGNVGVAQAIYADSGG